MPIQLFLNIDNKKCLKSSTNRSIIPNKACILRQGVESSKNQSFIACLANLYSDFGNKESRTIPNVIEMKQIIIDSLSVSKFVTYQNGSLVNIFTNKDMDVDMDKYKDEEKRELFVKKEKKNRIIYSVLRVLIVLFESGMVLLMISIHKILIFACRIFTFLFSILIIVSFLRVRKYLLMYFPK